MGDNKISFNKREVAESNIINIYKRCLTPFVIRRRNSLLLGTSKRPSSAPQLTTLYPKKEIVLDEHLIQLSKKEIVLDDPVLKYDDNTMFPNENNNDENAVFETIKNDNLFEIDLEPPFKVDIPNENNFIIEDENNFILEEDENDWILL